MTQILNLLSWRTADLKSSHWPGEGVREATPRVCPQGLGEEEALEVFPEEGEVTQDSDESEGDNYRLWEE